MDIFNTYNEVKSDKVSVQKRIATVSDLHIGAFFGNKTMDKLALAIDKVRPDIIAVSGDIFRGSRYSDPLSQMKLEYLYSLFGEIAPTTAVDGNRDKDGRTKKGDEYFRNLGKLVKNFYPLDNSSVQFGEINMIGFSPRVEAYSNSNIGQIASSMFVEDWKKSRIALPKKLCNVLLSHDPHTILDEHTISQLPEIYELVSVVLCGHLHNGYVPEWLEKMIGPKIGDKGILEDPRHFIVNHCRGVHTVDGSNISVQVSKGISKYSMAPIGASEIMVTDIMPTENLKSGTMSYRQ
jgi:Predicted phosphohydrolases